MSTDKEQNIQLAAKIISDKKGDNIVGLDVSEVSSMTNHILIAEGMIDRHVVAMAKTLQAEMKEAGNPPTRVEGVESGDWVVLDFVDLIVHIFTPQMRELFQLEKLFQSAKPLNLNLQNA
ncbi:MAG: ribosome silencing factor [Candidatus Algichlamydia australiensis]|nr:ribosome silencing factor [Chlamydiales bacterium]